MIRLDAARDAAGKTRDTLAPYAATAKGTAVHYADGARQRLAPRIEALAPAVEAAAAQARDAARSTARHSYDLHLAPRVEQVRAGVPPQVEEAAVRAAQRTKRTALVARDAAVTTALQARAAAAPAVSTLVEEARATAVPVAQEAQARGTAALAALRGRVSPADIEKLMRKHARRRRCGRAARQVLLFGLCAGGSAAAWAWWRKQSSPQWLVEPPTEPPTSSEAAGPSEQVQAVSATGLAAAEAATRGNTVDGSLPLESDTEAKQDRDGKKP